MITRFGLDAGSDMDPDPDDGQVPEDQTDGAFHEPDFAGTLFSEGDGEDTIRGNGGNDVVFGGDKGDHIDGVGVDVNGPRQAIADDGDIVIGDYGQLVFSPLGVSIQTTLIRAESTDPEFGGDDFIRVGDGRDIVIAGTGGDTVLAGGGDEVQDIVIGDNGKAIFIVPGALVLDVAFEAPNRIRRLTGREPTLSIAARSVIEVEGSGASGARPFRYNAPPRPSGR